MCCVLPAYMSIHVPCGGQKRILAFLELEFWLFMRHQMSAENGTLGICALLKFSGESVLSIFLNVLKCLFYRSVPVVAFC